MLRRSISLHLRYPDQATHPFPNNLFSSIHRSIYPSMALNEKKYHDASLRPPLHDPPAADAHRLASCLLDLTAYIADRTNGTTATCEARGGRRIQVTFFFVHPPAVSFLCVYCPGLPPTEFACEPTVVATEADLLLLRVVFGPYDNAFDLKMNDLCIYRAGRGKAPSLRHIPHPMPFVFFQDSQLALLPRYEEEADLYYIAALHNNNDDRRRHGHRRRRGHRKETSSLPSSGPFQIHLFSSKTGHWIAKPTSLDQRCQRHDELNHFRSSKVVTIGGEGGAVAWVDLWRGLLQCNVFDAIPELHYVRLPPPILPERILAGSPWLSRDIAMIQGRIKYVELQVRSFPGTGSDGQYISDGWTAAAWSRTATNPWEEDDWHTDSKVDSDQVSADPLLLDQLPKLQDSRGRPEPTLQRLHTGHPTLSLHDDSILYLMTKVAVREDHAWVLAVHMTKGKLQQVAKFGAERTLGISFSYVHSRISNYLSMDQGSRQRDGEVMYKESVNKLKTSVGLPNFKSIICVASWDELIKLRGAPGMSKPNNDPRLSKSNNDMPFSATSMSNNEPVIVVTRGNELSDKVSIVCGVSKSDNSSVMVDTRRNEVLDILRALAGMSNHEFSMAVARGDELCNGFPAIFNHELGMASSSAGEHSNNLPTACRVLDYEMMNTGASKQVYADKATDANTGGPATEIHRTVSFSSAEFVCSYRVMACFAILVAVTGLTVDKHTADQAMVFYNFVLLLCGLALLFAASSEKMCTLLDRFQWKLRTLSS